MAQTGQGWRAHVVDSGGLREIPDSDDARDPAISPDGKSLIYFDAAGRLILRSLVTDETRVVLSGEGKDTFTQAVFGASATEIIAVRLIDGRSRDSDLVAINANTGAVKNLVQERSAQFEPKQAGNTLVYSTIHCAATCRGLVQEIWVMKRPERIARQLTLNHAHSRDPAVDPKNGYVYYSSNLAGGFRIYRQSLAGGVPEPATHAVGLELWPAFDAEGQLWFVRDGIERSQLMCRAADGGEQEVELSSGITRLRELEITL